MDKPESHPLVDSDNNSMLRMTTPAG